jgi:putative phosphoesterase
MTTLGVISDTHIREGSRRSIPSSVWQAFEGVQLILHGGDFTASGVMTELETVAPVLAVRGNNDFGAFGDSLAVSRRVPVEQAVIGMVHGDRPVGNRAKPLADVTGNNVAGANAISHFEFDDDVHCIVFGHSHYPLLAWREIEGRRVLLLNPGSPTDRRFAPHFGCALLRIDGESIEAELIHW